MAIDDTLRERLNTLPRSPGVYLMRDHQGALLYIGKATDLRSRVRSYFGRGDSRPFVRLLDELLADVEVIVTGSAKEALLLENTLIKKHRPRFNFELRDDKTYLSIRIDPQHPWPRVDVVRRRRRDGARYFGPYHSAARVRQTIGVLNRFFQLRTCRDAVLNNRTRPCLQYQIHRCPAPCVLPVDRPAYMENVRRAMLFLEGRETELLDGLRNDMEEASNALAFEEAARLRDQIRAVESSLERQHAVRTDTTDCDAIGLARQGSDAMIVVLAFRNGSLTGMQRFPLSDQVVDDSALLASFLSQHHAAEHNPLPAEILLPVDVPDAGQIEDALSELRGRRLRVLTPQRGEKRRLVEMSTENAVNALDEHTSTSHRAQKALEGLAQKLGLRQVPRLVECYDISNFQGSAIVASQVVFLDGVANRDRWRRYVLHGVDAQDDFASLREVAARRARAAHDGNSPLPDLMVIDGGRGQLSAFLAGLADRGVDPPDVVSLAKARTIGTSSDDSTVHSSERVFLPGVREPILLKPHTDERYLLERIRNEAHRFAISFHRQRRRSRTLASELDQIRGIGPARRNALLRHLGSVRAVRNATLDDIAETPGFNRELAFAVFNHLHPGESDPPAPEE